MEGFGAYHLVERRQSSSYVCSLSHVVGHSFSIPLQVTTQLLVCDFQFLTVNSVTISFSRNWLSATSNQPSPASVDLQLWRCDHAYYYEALTLLCFWSLLFLPRLFRILVDFSCVNNGAFGYVWAMRFYMFLVTRSQNRSPQLAAYNEGVVIIFSTDSSSPHPQLEQHYQTGSVTIWAIAAEGA